MKLSKLFSTCILAIGFSLPLAACDDGGDGDTADTSAEADTTAGTDGGTTGETNDVDCSTFCTSFIDMCVQSGKSSEYETNDICLEACGTWDQAAINCRFEQIGADACDQAGEMGTAC